MISHRHARLRLRYQAPATLAVVFIALLFLLPHLFAQTPSPAQTGQASACSGTFAGVWRADVEVNSPAPSVTLTISVQGDYAEGLYAFGNARRKLAGKITGDTLTGDWRPEQKGEGGTFSATLTPARNEIVISFFYHQSGLDISHWFCPPSQAQPSPSPNQVVPVNPIVALLQGLAQQDSGVSSNHDTDQFKAFDALPKAQQEKLLVKNGPRLPRQYNASDQNLRVFVQGGAPLVIDYQLDSDAPASLTISVGELKPFAIALEPAKFAQRTIVLPDHFGKESQVGKLHLSALTSKGEPANFRLYGIAMGVSGAHALNKLIAVPRYSDLAMPTHSFGPVSSYEPLSLFASTPPQANQLIQITVSAPTSIVTGKKPKQEIAFSFTPPSLFDNGRWEILAVNGLDEAHVWNKKTGRLKPNKRMAEKWDGKLTYLAKIVPGDYSLKVTAWRGDVSHGFVIARAPANLVVIK
jgi:hypothetical protein